MILGLFLFAILLGYNYKLNKESQLNHCNPNAQCMKLSSLLSLTNMFIGIIFSLASLGFYLIFFNKGEEAILKNLEENKNSLAKLEQSKRQINKEERFEIMVKALSQDEQKLIRIIKDQEGITQATLRLKTDYSKTKLSFVLADLEKKGLIKKELSGKTNKLYIKEGIFSLTKQSQA